MEEQRLGRGEFDAAPAFPLSKGGKEYVPPPPIPSSVRTSRAGSEAGLYDGRGGVEAAGASAEAVEDRLMRYAREVEEKRHAQ